MHPRDQTIFALSSGRAPSAIAIVRVSGPQAGTVLTALAGKLPMPEDAVWDPQAAHVGLLVRRGVEQAEEPPAEIVVGLGRLVV